MITWFGRRRVRPPAPTLKPRREGLPTARVDLAELTPGLTDYLGQAAYLELVLFDSLASALAAAPSIEAKAALTPAVEAALEKHRGLLAVIEHRGESAPALMAPFVRRIDEFQRLTRGADWHENLISAYVSAGFLDDFFLRLAAGLPGEYAVRVNRVFAADSHGAAIASLLREGIEGKPRLASRLALCGRRLVGDIILVARSSLVAGLDHDSDEQRIEPVFTELIAAHTRRMDALGLTA